MAEADLRQAFEAFGQVTSVRLIMDRETGRSKGFAFVEMASEAEGNAAIQALNGKALKGRAVTVNVARPKEDRGPGGPPRGGGRGGFGR
jgi:RNA recognition motif-containing protein